MIYQYIIKKKKKKSMNSQKNVTTEERRRRIIGIGRGNWQVEIEGHPSRFGEFRVYLRWDYLKGYERCI